MAVRLTLILSGRAYKEHEFQTFKKLKIGRSEDCEIRIDNLGVSRYHCEIVDLGGSYQLHALSQNPTLVNGLKVDTYNLNDGDAITLGKFTVAFSCDQVWTTDDGVSHSELMGEATLGDEAAMEAARVSSLVLALGYLSEGEKDAEDKRHELKNPFFTFGKDDDCDVRIGGWGTPRLAAIVIREEQGFRLMDLSSKCDAVTLNGKACRDKHLSDSDTFEVKGRTWRFFSGAAGDLR